jgi:hypothetical protein
MVNDAQPPQDSGAAVAPVQDSSLARDPAQGLAPQEIGHFAGELAAQLFHRWQVALEQQFEAELRFRLGSELEHRERRAVDLREEVQERRARRDNPWNRRHGPFGQATFEMEQTVRRRSAELAEIERQMGELRARLRELRGEGGAPVVTPGSGPARRPDGTPDEATSAVEVDLAEAPAPAETAVAPVAGDAEQLAVGLAAQLFRPWEQSLRERFREEMGRRLEDELVRREHEAGELRQEIDERQAVWEGLWSDRHRRGATTDTERWEMERRILRQASELEETEAAIREIRRRLGELGGSPGEAPVIVDSEDVRSPAGG